LPLASTPLVIVVVWPLVGATGVADVLRDREPIECREPTHWSGAALAG
jgi:hypothetical protein